MSGRVAINPFSNFINKSTAAKIKRLADLKNSPSESSEKAIRSLTSRVIQLGKIIVPTLAELSKEEWSLYRGNNMIREQAKALGILGNILPYELESETELSLRFHDQTGSRRGNLILPEQMLMPPAIQFQVPESEKDGLSLVMFDCDFPSESGLPSFYLLWLRDKVETAWAKDIVPYVPALPERGSGIHRIVSLLVRNCNSEYAELSRNSFSLDSLLSGNSKIVAYNFFQTIWTRTVSEQFVFHSKEAKERLFGKFIHGPGQ